MAKLNFTYRGKNPTGKLSLRLIHSNIYDFRISTPIVSKKDYWFKRTTKTIKGEKVTKMFPVQLKDLNSNGSADFKSHKTNIETLENKILDKFITDNNNGIPITTDWLRCAVLEFSKVLDSKDEVEIVLKAKNKIKEDAEQLEQRIKNINLLSTAIAKMFVKYKTNKNELKKYKVTHGLLLKYQSSTKEIYSIKDVNQDFANHFMNWAFIDMKYSKSYINAQLKRFRSAAVKAYEADEEDIIKVSKTLRTFTMFDKIYKDKIVVTLNYDELDKIDNKEITNPKLFDAKKALLIGCETGLRYSDMNKLIDTNIKNVEGVNYWKFRTEKTDSIVQITVTNRILYLIEKYGLPQTNYPKNGVKLNEDIKKVCALAEIKESIKGKKATVIKVNKKDVTRNIIDYHPKHELITSRTFRRSFATNYYGKIDTALITSITGHATESQLRAYISNNDESNILRTKNQIDAFHAKRKSDKNNIKLTIIPKAANQN
jgi:integrase